MKKHTFLVSDESINNYGFKVLTQGIDTAQFERNPIMLYMHERPTIIGRWENLTKKEGKLYADAVFDIEDEMANKIAGKVERGFLKGASIGISFKKDDKQNDVITKSQLHEISIVDLGSNNNALRLYDDKEIVNLNFEELTTTGTLIDLLGLSKEVKHGEIIDTVKTLKSDTEKYKQELAKVKTAQDKEAKFLVNMLVERKLIQPVTKGIYEQLFEDDFEKGKKAVIDVLPLKTRSLIEMVESQKRLNKNADKTTKSKSEWDLEDYRKFAPKELESNPKLYKELVNKKVN